ncbi:hypothetical protein [Rhizobium leguminosarum]|uniref:hypothetical protein n=1 Tax=Rhizobium leguminosarum TaxID=384 RepID=UPI003F9E42CA
MTVAAEIARLGRQHDLVDGYPEWIATNLSRIKGIEGDRTLDAIAALRRTGIISVDEMTDLTLRHVRETRNDRR